MKNEAPMIIFSENANPIRSKREWLFIDTEKVALFTRVECALNLFGINEKDRRVILDGVWLFDAGLIMPPVRVCVYFKLYFTKS